MKTLSKYTMLLSLGLLIGAAAATRAADSSEDQVTLKNGSTLSGQIVEESSTQVIIEVKGTKKTLDRTQIAKLSYGGGPSEAEGSALAAAPAGNASTEAAPASAAGNVVSELAQEYGVREADVLWVRRQGITDADLPMVFWVAANAQVQTKVVVRLRLERWTWSQIEGHFGLGAEGVDPALAPVVVQPYYYDPYYPYGWGWGWGWGGGWHGGWDGGGHGGWGGGHHWR